ncbi:farnesyl diphosphate synthase [Variovorax boronicumulans]|uniref:polyprenyl synthetase family protein n=1 Tax=Variovorax boronicumulans TaxID=436515 RepID=UPI0027881185|nr:farnesyl diphosphate synthase [Variovorax boronicumulans]MDP9913630.1 farnesyl diphosphate synthase [Variovorax boronicumulans]
MTSAASLQAEARADPASGVGAGDAFDAWVRDTLRRTEHALAVSLPPADTLPSHLHEALRYAALGGGKRIRPLLCQAAGDLAEAPPDALDATGAAIEMIHVYSLVHDDLPAMDDDDLRRGKPTVHVAYDEATAILVGDALQAQAFYTLSALPLPAERRIALVRELAQAAGSRQLVGGQAIDLHSIGHLLGQPELEQMHRMKTGALIRAAARMGALCGVADTPPNAALYRALDAYSAAIGLAFQVVDDILDATADTATLGKTTGKDAGADKPTCVSMLGLEASRALAGALRERAHAALAPLAPRGRRLGQLADLIVHRTH